jgi:two-component system response regulator MprA
VIDDERAIRDLVRVALDREGFSVRVAADGVAALGSVREWEPECVLLDVMMPKLDGLSLIPMLRRLTEVPIILLTARGDVRVEGLKAGADDYVPKPFDVEELAARVQSALRRPTLRQVEHLRYADLELDLGARTVRRDGREIALSAREFDLLAVLMRRPKRVFSRNALLDLVWGADRDVSLATVQTYISYLRAKIDVGGAPKLIHTIHGVGYSLRT